MAYEEAYSLLINNMSIFGSVNNLYTTLMSAWWIFILYVATLFTIYMVSKSEAALAGWGLIGSAFLLYKLSLIPVGMQVVLYIIMSLSLAMVLYKVYSSR